MTPSSCAHAGCPQRGGLERSQAVLTAAAKRCAVTARARRHRDQRRRRTPTPSTRTKSSSSSPVVGRPFARSIGRTLCRLVGVVVSRCRCGARVLCRHRCRLFHWLLFVDQRTVDIRVSPVSILGQLFLYTPLGRWVGVGISPILFLFYVNPFVFLRQLDGSSSDPTLKFGGVVGELFRPRVLSSSFC